MKLKKLLSMLLLLTLIVGLNPITLKASEISEIKDDTSLNTVEIDLNSIDLNQSFSESNVFVNENGETYISTISFTPSKTKSSNPASVGTWTSKYDGIGMTMSYKFDVTKSGSQWKISNARSHSYSGLFYKFSSPNLYISRSVSTNSFPAEINAEVTADLFDNQWVHIYSGVWIMYTTIDSGGTMTVYNN